jgi:uncharacterized protein YcaQ
MGFVQADPIRSPARAQDLILRHRVKDYRAGDLERCYPDLDLEEDYLYAYGFMPRSNWRLLHPRSTGKLTAKEKRVLEFAELRKRIHPRDLDETFGRNRARNDWGGQSIATTRILQALHYRGALRVAGRQNGIRLYEPTVGTWEAMDPDERARALAMLVARVLGPLPESSLLAALAHVPGLGERRSVVRALAASGELTVAPVDGVRYLLPGGPAKVEPDEAARFLAPFDPLVWDRRRFEHFWGWAYRFEAYTPASKRQLGYYAMPVLWRNDIVGWVNVRSGVLGTLDVEPGFKKPVADDKPFRLAFDAEVERMKMFLGGA